MVLDREGGGRDGVRLSLSSGAWGGGGGVKKGRGLATCSLPLWESADRFPCICD